MREGRVGARDEGREAAARGRSAEGRGARSRVRRASARAAEGAGDAVDVDMKGEDWNAGYWATSTAYHGGPCHGTLLAMSHANSSASHVRRFAPCPAVRADGRVTVQVSTTEGRGDRADARAEQDPSPPRARKAALMHAPSWTLFDRGEREKRRSKPRPDQVQVSQPDEGENHMHSITIASLHAASTLPGSRSSERLPQHSAQHSPMSTPTIHCRPPQLSWSAAGSGSGRSGSAAARARRRSSVAVRPMKSRGARRRRRCERRSHGRWRSGCGGRRS